MISAFRRMLEGPLKWVFIVLLIAAFAVFGVPALDNFSPQTAIKVGDRAFSAQEVQQAFTRQLAVAQQEQGRGFTRQEAIEAGLLDQTVQRLVAEQLVEEEARRLGLTATDEMVSRAVRESGAFDDPQSGEFDPRLFSLALQQNGIAPSVFREDVRGEIVRNQLTGALTGRAPAPEALVDALVMRTNELREVRTAVVSAEDAAPATQDALRSYYAANAARYAAPETRTFRALLIDEASAAEGVEITEEELRALYDSRAATLGTPERRSFRQARFTDADQAQEAADRVAAGENLGDVARDLGVGATYQADQTTEDVVDPAVAEAVFAAEAPGVVGPVQGVFGTIVAEVEAIEPGTGVSFEEAREDLEAEFRAEISQGRYLDAIEEVEAARDQGVTLEEAADAAGLAAPRRYGPVDRDLFTPEGAIEDVPGAVARTAFALNLGDESDAISLDDGGYAFVVVDDVIPEATRPFEAVEAQVRRDYEATQQDEALDRAVAAFEAAAAGEAGFEGAAEAIGSDVQAQSLSARRPDPTLPVGFLRAVFDAPIGEVASAPTGDGQAIVAIVDEVSFGADPSGGAAARQLSDSLGSALTAELVNSYLEALQTEIGVERNDVLIGTQVSGG